jgi:hypothetical protein
MPTVRASKALRYLLVLLALWSLAIAGSFVWNAWSEQQQMRQEAMLRAASLAEQLERIGHSGDLVMTENLLQDLESEISNVFTVLRKF